MALSKEQIGLVFRLDADAKPATANIQQFSGQLKSQLSGLPAAFQAPALAAADLANKIAGFAGQSVEMAAQQAGTAAALKTSAQAFQVLEGALVNHTGSVKAARSVMGEFGNALRAAAGGNTELSDTFKLLGVNIAQALASPRQGLAQFLQGFSRLENEAQKAAIAEAVFLGNAKELVPALSAAAAGMQGLAVAEGEAAAAATAANLALTPLALTVALVAGAVVGLAAAAGTVWGLAKSAADAGDQVQRLSEKTGVSVRNISLLRAAAKEAGVDFNVVNRMLDQFITRMDDAARSTGKTEWALAFKRVGIDAKEGLANADQALETAIAKLADYGNAANKAADAQRIFGLRNDEAILVINRLRGSLEDYEKRLAGMGIITAKQAQEARAFNVVNNQLNATISGLARSLGAQLIPYLIPFIDLLRAAIQVINPLTLAARTALGVLTGWFPTLRGLIELISRFIPSVRGARDMVDNFTAALRAAPAFVKVFETALSEAGGVLSKLIAALGTAGGAIKLFLEGNFAGAAAAAGEAKTAIGNLFDGVGEKTKAAWENAKAAQKAALADLRANRTLDASGTSPIDFSDGKTKKDKKAKDTLAQELALIKARGEFLENAARREIELAERAFEEKGLSAQHYEEIATAAELRILEIKQKTFAAEKAEIEGSKASAADKAAKLQQITNQEITALQETETKIYQIKQKAKDKLKRLDEEASKDREKAYQEQREREQRELGALRDFIQARNQLLADLSRARVDTLEARARELEQRAQSQPRFTEAAKAARKEAELAALESQRMLYFAQLRGQELELLALAKTQQQKLEIENRFSALRLEAVRQFQIQRQQIEDQFKTPSFTKGLQESFFGKGFVDGLATMESKLAGFRNMFADWGASLRAELEQLPSLAETTLGAIKDGLTEMAVAFVLTGQTGPAAMRQLAAGVLAALAKMAATKAIFELAEGFAALARGFLGDPRGFVEAGHHFTAAAIYGAVGAVAGFAARAVAPSSGAPGGASNNNQSNGPRIIEQGERGKAQAPNVVIIRVEHAPGMIARQVVDDFKNNGITRQAFRADMLGEQGA